MQSSRNRQAGVGLIEVMIAVLILAVGLLGIASLQALTLKNAGASAERTQAVIQTYSMMDTLRAQRAAAVAGSFNTTGTDGFQCSAATALGTPGTLVGWLADLRQTVAPTACGRVACTTATGGVTNCDIRVRWDETRATGGDENATVQTITRL